MKLKCKMNNELETPILSTAQLAIRERNSKWFWVCIICGFFAMDFSIAAIAISMAAGDPSFRSIPGYGERAVAWDVRQKRKEVSRKLGWKIDIQRVEPLHDAVEIRIGNAANGPVTGCTGSLRLFHFTRVAEQFHSQLCEIEPGLYRATVDVAKLGRWQLELEIHADGDQHFWDERTLNWFESPSQDSGSKDSGILE